MPLDFSKIAAPSNAETLIKPREIFAALPGKDPKYNYLRDVQAEVLDQWYARRDLTDTRLKMNTGGGKTLVGLLMLKSCLNENKGPAIYVAPTPYLATQVAQEARALGLAVEDDPRSAAVGRGKAILITHVHVLLNGKSKFGVGKEEIPIGSLVLDDAHACLSTAERQFTLELPSTHPAYSRLFQLFRPDLEAQSSMGVLDVEQGDPAKLMLVPFWSWLDKITTVEAILHPHRDDDEIKFVWPLIRNHLRQCRCVFGGGRGEISPRCLPVEVIPSFAHAKRRIFMSATFADDSVLVTDFDARHEHIATAVAPGSASDLGNRMILVPQELDPKITDEDIRALAVEKAKTLNVVVIVPSHRRAAFWSGVAAEVLAAEHLDAGVARLKQGHIGLVVIVNKYDGIDLPNAACRLLILDGVPDARRAIDQIEEAHLHGTSLQLGRAIQQIEQGMGRGVRASDDFCVVLLMGRSLTGHLFTRNGITQLTPATRAQFELSEQIGNQIRGKGIIDIANAADYALRQDPAWVTAAKSALVHATYATASADVSIAVGRRKAFTAAASGNLAHARDVLQGLVNAATDSTIRGWLMAELAEYTHGLNPVEAQQILQTAHDLNRQLPRPHAGITYQRLSPLSGEQAAQAIAFIRSRFKQPNDLIVAANAVADDLAFRPSSYKKFHRAMRDAAALLGFQAQLPESEFGAGPDVLWAVGALRYFVIECKNEATSETVNKKDCNQLAGSANWFGNRYDATCSMIPLMVHPSSLFEFASTPPPNARIMTTEGLAAFRTALLAFSTAVAGLTQFGTPKDVAALLAAHKLVPDAMLASFTVAPTKR
jgi:hypothetical protein